MLNRAELSRTGMVFRAAHTQTEDYLTVQALRFMREKWCDLDEQSQRKAHAAGITVIKDIDRKPFEEAMAPIHAKAARAPAAAALIDPIRKVE